jgi:hypothetical protein
VWIQFIWARGNGHLEAGKPFALGSGKQPPNPIRIVEVDAEYIFLRLKTAASRYKNVEVLAGFPAEIEARRRLGDIDVVGIAHHGRLLRHEIPDERIDRREPVAKADKALFLVKTPQQMT